MNIVDAMKRSKETGEEFSRPNDRGLPVRYSVTGEVVGLSAEDLIADDWEAVPLVGAIGIPVYVPSGLSAKEAGVAVRSEIAAQELIAGTPACPEVYRRIVISTDDWEVVPSQFTAPRVRKPASEVEQEYGLPQGFLGVDPASGKDFSTAVLVPDQLRSGVQGCIEGAHLWDGSSPNCLCGKVAMAPKPSRANEPMGYAVKDFSLCDDGFYRGQISPTPPDRPLVKNPVHSAAFFDEETTEAQIKEFLMRALDGDIVTIPRSPMSGWIRNTGEATAKHNFPIYEFETTCKGSVHFQKEGEAKCVCGKMFLIDAVMPRYSPAQVQEVTNQILSDIKASYEKPDEPKEATFYLGTKCEGDSHVQIGGKDRCECGKFSVPASPEWGMEEPDIVKRDE